MQIFGLCNFMRYCTRRADNSDDVHDGVRQRQKKNDDGDVAFWFVHDVERNPCTEIR